MSMLNEARRGSITDTRDRSLKGRIKEIIPWKGDDIKEILRKLVFIVAVCVLCYSAYDAYIYKFGSTTMKTDQEDLANLYNPGISDNADPTENDNQDPNGTAAIAPDDNTDQQDQPNANEVVSKYPAGMSKSFEQLYDINPDIVGWITIDGLYLDDSSDNPVNAINNPVVQTVDNDFYLSHDFYKNEQDYGALYIDYRAVPYGENRSNNVTIYGHNMGTGYFFARLHKYNDKSHADFVSEHRLVTFNTLYDESEYIIFGCFLVGIYESDDNQPLFRYHNVVNFNSMSDFDYWYKNVMYRNYYITDIDCDINDEYLSLSTCSYETMDSRFVVVARKLRDGEDPSVYKYRSNPKKHMPKKYLEAFGMEVSYDDGPDYEYYTPN